MAALVARGVGVVFLLIGLAFATTSPTTHHALDTGAKTAGRVWVVADHGWRELGHLWNEAQKEAH